MNQLIKDLIVQEDGASASEYAILVAFIAAAVAASIKLFDLNSVFSGLSTKVSGIVTNAK